MWAVSLPAPAAAYFTKAQSATMLPDGSGILYTVTYDFGMQTSDVYLPIRAERKVDSASQSRTLTYAIIDEGEVETEYGTTAGIVLSNAEIRRDGYFVPKGVAKRFVLVTVLSLPKTAPAESLDLALQVTNLPFTIVNNGLSFSNQLNPSELQYYLTPEVDVRAAN
jgi:hypothetical protein